MPRLLAGRERELELLGSLLPDAGHGQAVVISGEAGIGKSALVAAFADHVRTRDGVAAIARCSTVGAGPFWVWQQLLESLGARPAIAGSDVFPWQVGGATSREFAFVEATRAMRGLLEPGHAALVVLEDLHWADESSLALLRFVIDALPELPLLFALTVRDPPESDAAAELLAELPTTVVRLPLTGLDETASTTIVRSVLGPGVTNDVAAAIHGRAGGNPFFVSEIARLQALRAGGASTAVPSGVRQVLERRLARLTQTTHEVLKVASLCEVVDTDLLAATIGSDHDAVHRAIEEALRARLLALVDGTVGFAHDLVREVLVDGLGTRTAQLHRRLALALEERGTTDHERLTFHWWRAAGDDAATRAAWHARQAARRASEQMAYEQAVSLYAMAIDRRVDADPELLVEAGEAHALAGDLGAGRTLLRDAARRALQGGHPELAGRALLAMGGGLGGFEVDLSDDQQPPLLRRALDLLEDRDPSLRAALLARLSLADAWSASTDTRIALAREAVALARRVSEEAVEVSALSAYCDAISGPDHIDERLAASTRMLGLAAATGDVRLVLLARRLRLVALLERGNLAEADREIAAYASTVDGLDLPLYAWPVPLWRGMRALLDGDVETALARADETAALAQRSRSWNARDMAFTLRVWALRTAGRLADAHVDFDDELDEVVGLPGAECAFAGYYAAAGRPDLARTMLDRRMAAGLDTLPKDSEWLEFLWNLSEAAIAADDHAAVRALSEALEPYAEVWAVDGVGAAVLGSVAHQLGVLAAHVGDELTARRRFEQALDLHKAAGAAGPVAATREGLAALSGGDATPQRNGDALHGTFRREGGSWRLAWRGRTVLVADSKGMADIATMLAAPATAIDTLELVARGAVPPEGDAGPVIDDQARRAYRHRLEELDAALEEAEHTADAARRSGLVEERRFLLGELSRAVGLGGRARHAGDPRERARKAVARRVHTALRAIEAVHPPLERHLSISLRMGRFCSYEPEQPVTWST